MNNNVVANGKVNNSNWYIVQVYSGSEQSVKKEITKRAEKNDLSSMIEEIFVPVKEITEIKKGKKVKVSRNFFPGYIFMKMHMDDNMYHFVNDVPKVSRFLTSGNKPKVVPYSEVKEIIDRMDKVSEEENSKVNFEMGEAVKIIDGGSFDGFVGVIEDIEREKGLLTVSVTIFGRSTPLILEYGHVEKI